MVQRRREFEGLGRSDIYCIGLSVADGSAGLDPWAIACLSATEFVLRAVGLYRPSPFAVIFVRRPRHACLESRDRPMSERPDRVIALVQQSRHDYRLVMPFSSPRFPGMDINS